MLVGRLGVNMAWIHNKDSFVALFLYVCVCVCVDIALRQKTTTSHSQTGSVSKWPVLSLTRKWSVEGVTDKSRCQYSRKSFPYNIKPNHSNQNVKCSFNWCSHRPKLIRKSTNIMLQMMKICYFNKRQLSANDKVIII